MKITIQNTTQILKLNSETNRFELIELDQAVKEIFNTESKSMTEFMIIDELRNGYTICTDSGEYVAAKI